MRLTPDYACENAHEAPAKKKKEIYFLYFLIYLPLTIALAVNLSRFLFSYARSTIFYSEQGRCMKVYPANLLVHDMKSYHLGELREVIQEPHAKRGACARKKKS